MFSTRPVDHRSVPFAGWEPSGLAFYASTRRTWELDIPKAGRFVFGHPRFAFATAEPCTADYIASLVSS